MSDLFFLIFCAKHETQGDNNTHSTITLKLVCNPVYIHDTFKNNHNYLYTHTHTHTHTHTYIYIYIYILFAYWLWIKNKLKLTFRIINIKIELVMPRQHFLRDQSLHQNNLEKSLTKTILLRRVALLVFLYT